MSTVYWPIFYNRGIQSQKQLDVRKHLGASNVTNLGLYWDIYLDTMK